MLKCMLPRISGIVHEPEPTKHFRMRSATRMMRDAQLTNGRAIAAETNTDPAINIDRRTQLANRLLALPGTNSRNCSDTAEKQTQDQWSEIYIVVCSKHLPCKH